MKIAKKITSLLPIFFVLSCSSKYDACIEKQKEDFRASNPSASYALVQKKQAEFEMMCSSLKNK